MALPVTSRCLRGEIGTQHRVMELSARSHLSSLAVEIAFPGHHHGRDAVADRMPSAG